MRNHFFIERPIAVMLSILAYIAAMPPWSLPLCYVHFSLLVFIWRQERFRLPVAWFVCESLVVGFLSAWLTSEYIRDAVPLGGNGIRFIASAVFSSHYLAIAVAVRSTRNQSVVTGALICASVAVLSEAVQTVFGIWSVATLSLSIAETPIAQLSEMITPFGISRILYFSNFLFVTAPARTIILRWRGPFLAAGLIAVAFCAGGIVGMAVPIDESPFSVMLVQPNVCPRIGEDWTPWLQLGMLTGRDRDRTAAVDLIVWTEDCLSPSLRDFQDLSQHRDTTHLSVHEFAQLVQPTYGRPCIVGSRIGKRVQIKRFGVTMTQVAWYNCGCMVTGPGRVEYHEKLALVPLAEAIPKWLDWDPLRCWISSWLQRDQWLVAGNSFQSMYFVTRNGETRSVAVSICYESFFPWLPQYSKSSRADAVVHLIHDCDSILHPELRTRHLRACRFRAIETRKWQFVCSTWEGTAMINPRGEITSQLAARADVLQSEPLAGQQSRRNHHEGQ